MAYQVPAHLAKFASKFHSTEQFAMPLGQAFPRISIGKERFTAIDAEGEETLLGLDSFEFITVASNPATSKVHFDGPYVSGSDTPPDCYSHNGYYPDVRSSNPQCESCALCPHNRWGSAKSNMTGKDVKACGDFKMLAVEPLHDDITGVHQFRVSPGALKNWARYLNELRKIGADAGIENLTPDLVITKAFWADKNVMGFEFVDFLDEGTCDYVAEVKEANEYESWIGLDSQAQTYPMLASSPRAEPQRLAPPRTKEAASIQEAEVIEEKPAKRPPLRSRTEALEVAKEPVGRSSRHPRGEDEPVSGRARVDAAALGAKQGERKMTPIEIAKARSRQGMQRPA
jgi:hypothetical protein